MSVVPKRAKTSKKLWDWQTAVNMSRDHLARPDGILSRDSCHPTLQIYPYSNKTLITYMQHRNFKDPSLEVCIDLIRRREYRQLVQAACPPVHQRQVIETVWSALVVVDAESEEETGFEAVVLSFYFLWRVSRQLNRFSKTRWVVDCCYQECSGWE